jgi:broad specificity phosphatase PhoE
MSVLLFVRHGQASFQSSDYDLLSPIGERQSQLLGTYWASGNMVFDHVYVGPRRRHQQTHDAVASVYRERGLSWPDPVVLPELDEYQVLRLIDRQLLPVFMERNPLLRELATDFVEKGDRTSERFQTFFVRIVRLWVRGELDGVDIEPWTDFRARVETAIEKITEGVCKGKTIVVFTSGGPLAVATGRALGLGDEKTWELSWVVRNAAYAEFFFSDGRFSLSAFNTIPHLNNPDLLTYI